MKPLDGRRTLLSGSSSLGELIEDVETSFIPDLANYSSLSSAQSHLAAYLLQQIIRNLSSDRLTHSVEHDLEIFTLLHQLHTYAYSPTYMSR